MTCHRSTFKQHFFLNSQGSPWMTRRDGAHGPVSCCMLNTGLIQFPFLALSFKLDWCNEHKKLKTIKSLSSGAAKYMTRSQSRNFRECQQAVGKVRGNFGGLSPSSSAAHLLQMHRTKWNSQKCRSSISLECFQLWEGIGVPWTPCSLISLLDGPANLLLK